MSKHKVLQIFIKHTMDQNPLRWGTDEKYMNKRFDKVTYQPL